MNFADDRSLLHQPSVKQPFLFDRLQVLFFHLMITCYFFITATVGAKRLTEWQMNIKADPFNMVLLAEFYCEGFFPSFNRNRIFPIGYGRVAGITWHRPIVLPYQKGIDKLTFHRSKITAAAAIQDDAG